MSGQICFGIVIVFFIAVIGTVNPWRPLHKRDQLRSPIAVAAWWLWMATLVFLLVLNWCAPLRGYLQGIVESLVTRRAK